MNRLTRADDPVIGKTSTYAYDNRGNITSKIEYEYTTGSQLGTPTKTDTYSYTNTVWKDKLTNYNGQTITYDEIGNPLTYRNGITFTWKNGRQLATYSKNNVTTTYNYNVDGRRI